MNIIIELSKVILILILGIITLLLIVTKEQFSSMEYKVKEFQTRKGVDKE